MKNTPMQEYLTRLEEKIVSYKLIRGRWKRHSQKWEVYDLMVRHLIEECEHIESKLPAERQAIEDAFKKGWNERALYTDPHNPANDDDLINEMSLYFITYKTAEG